MLTVGPASRRLLAAAGTDIDLSAEAFPHMSLRGGEVAGVPARVARVSFTGELSYEINVPSSRTEEVWLRRPRSGAARHSASEACARSGSTNKLCRGGSANSSSFGSVPSSQCITLRRSTMTPWRD